MKWGQDSPKGTQTSSGTTARGVRKQFPVPSPVLVNVGEENVTHWPLTAAKVNSDTGRRSYEENA